MILSPQKLNIHIASLGSIRGQLCCRLEYQHLDRSRKREGVHARTASARANAHICDAPVVVDPRSYEPQLLVSVPLRRLHPHLPVHHDPVVGALDRLQLLFCCISDKGLEGMPRVNILGRSGSRLTLACYKAFVVFWN